MDYLPHFYDTEGRKWDVLTMNVCIDFGGRQVQLEAHDVESAMCKSFVYYYKDNHFLQWDIDEGCDVRPLHGKLTAVFKLMFDMFSEEKNETD